MVQGAVKKSAKPAQGSKARPQQAKKGARVAKSKKASSADKMQKKYAAGMVAKTEKLLGERVGHLELIGKGKKAPKDDDKTKKKGGSKKFG